MPRRITSFVSIYTLSGLGVLRNLIGSLSRTIQYSPPNKWIICEVGVFPIFFLENDLSKVHKIPGLMFFKANGMSPVEEAVLWTQRFLARNILPKLEVYLWETKLKANVCRNSTFQVNRTKNTTGKRRLTLEQPSRHVSSSLMRRKRLKPSTAPLESCHVWKFWKDL